MNSLARLFVAMLVTGVTALLAVAHGVDQAAQSGGDQFLDGIGETSLTARYQLQNNAEDSSRNQFHATVRGTGSFVDDPMFQRALLLTGDGSHAQLPANTLENEDTLSVTTWLFLPTGASGPVFDFGRELSNRLFATASREGLRAGAVLGGTTQGTAAGGAIAENQWVHVAVVLDPAARSLTAYVDGARVGQAASVTATGTQILSKSGAARLFLGRSQKDGDATLHGRLRDFRIYRIALTDQQVATIRTNSLPGRRTTRGRGAPPPEISTAGIPTESPLAASLSHVPDITVETVVGTMPRLPATVPAVYRSGKPGPDVRVIWPAPVDNKQVAAPGSYDVTGRIPGTSIAPKATVVVKVPVGVVTPPSRLVEPFALTQVMLDRDTKGRDTPFMRNRDKFLRGLAASNPDNFLYNFRDAFGQPQPAGAQQLEGWDNQTTRLRGHASGHYLSAIAQAYASTTYDKELRANFLQKMNYLIDTLCDRS